MKYTGIVDDMDATYGNFMNYMEAVIGQLEYIGYPELTVGFNPSDVAASMSHAIASGWQHSISHRWCAVSLYGITMDTQIIPYVKKMSKN